MSQPVATIPLEQLGFAFIPVLLVIAIFMRNSLSITTPGYAIFRMLIQLLLIGYVLGFIFNAHNLWVVLLVVAVMILVSSWIALSSIPQQRNKLLLNTLVGMSIGGTFSLVCTIFGVLDLSPWYQPSVIVPLAGMTYSNAMNSVSLAAERWLSELQNQQSSQQAKRVAFQTAMIPVVNSLFAVGLVALPGMMTGQILSGVDPLIAARYQVMVMCMLFGASGLATAIFLYLCNDKAVA